MAYTGRHCHGSRPAQPPRKAQQQRERPPRHLTFRIYPGQLGTGSTIHIAIYIWHESIDRAGAPADDMFMAQNLWPCKCM